MIFKNFEDQGWIGFNFCGSGLDSDWKISQSAHLWQELEVLPDGCHLNIATWCHEKLLDF